jgi:hypothetical protein
MNSTIIRKKKHLGCGCFDYAFSKNRCKLHATIEDTKKRAEKYAAQPTVRKAGWFDLNEAVNSIVGNGGSKLQRWFEDRHKEMTGKCKNCGGKTQKGQANYKNSVAHILPKAYFPSIATHPDNFIELCFYGESCHTNMDNKTLDLIDMNCFDEIVQKFCKIYPSISLDERRRIPKILLNYLESEI